MTERILSEERRVRERFGLLGGSTTSMSADNKVVVDTRIPVCDVCGTILKKDETTLCSDPDCQSKQCKACTIYHESRCYCPESAKRVVQVSKQEFMVLYGIHKELSLQKIAKFSSMKQEEVIEAIQALLTLNHIERKGISLFIKYKLTSKAYYILDTCMQIFQREGDVAHFLSEVTADGYEKKV